LREGNDHLLPPEDEPPEDLDPPEDELDDPPEEEPPEDPLYDEEPPL